MASNKVGFGAILALGLLGACASSPAPKAVPAPPTSLAEVGELRPGMGFAKGYLAPEALPDSLALLPAPPAAGTSAFAADEEALANALQAPADRFQKATSDADLHWPHVLSSYEAILGTPVSGQTTPHTAMLLQRAMADAGLSTYRAKTHYNRVRPFALKNVPSCTPGDEAALRNDGSYPSGHTAIGWIIALVLTDLAPQKTNELLQRGYDFGQSRVICRVHWKSDVEAGRLIASATFARLQADPVYQAQRDLARAEVARALKP
ncbi:phosphatase PAP2 family protein [Sandaracinobacter sp. RS1-74]|uniref:acid phosphatase n=1 Tax=Sandaracinobacteroides sayramensis TaxID=2913411 RepID=UPI001EDBC787|nr:phosphatase PAP2 family protein [Sandaracinobacteroides sayramensis]MCG2841934.1 phosphatase PAP2 family protein [Sandaracinobacteroides sayramensis]